MVIDYEKYPALRCISSGLLGDVSFDERFKKYHFSMVSEIFERRVDKYKREVLFVSTSKSNGFTSAVSENIVKLRDLVYKTFELDGESLDFSGTIVRTGPGGGNVSCLDFHAEKGSDELELTYFLFDNNNELIAYYFHSDLLKREYGYLQGIAPETEWLEVKLSVFRFISTDLVYILFKKYASVETKTIFPNRKDKYNGEKFLNRTELTATILNCTWFTNLVRSEGFNVRGHFRLQPCKKDGKWTKELIWIDEFQKHGYSMKARMLQQNENN